MRDEHIDDPAVEIEQLKRALETRGTISLAIGMTMERYDLDSETAKKFLVRISQNNNRKLSDIAAEIVTTRLIPEDHLTAARQQLG